MSSDFEVKLFNYFLHGQTYFKEVKLFTRFL